MCLAFSFGSPPHFNHKKSAVIPAVMRLSEVGWFGVEGQTGSKNTRTGTLPALR